MEGATEMKFAEG